jgi:hypothetical protein
MILYKYLRADTGLKVLASAQIAFTPPERFNDPFECLPYVTSLASSESLAAIMSETRAALLASGYEELPDWAKTLVSQAQYVQLLDSARPVAEAMMGSGEELILDLAVRPALGGIRGSIGILSLSEVNDSLLMWAYYADSHTGMALGFDANHRYFDQRLGPEDDLRHLRCVEYRAERPQLRACDLDGIEIYLVKSQQWSHEKEWRMAQPLGAATVVERTSQDVPIYLFDYPPECLKSLLLGSRVAPNTRARVQELLQDSRYAHVELVGVRPCHADFGLELRPIKMEPPDAPQPPSQPGE